MCDWNLSILIWTSQREYGYMYWSLDKNMKTFFYLKTFCSIVKEKSDEFFVKF